MTPELVDDDRGRVGAAFVKLSLYVGERRDLSRLLIEIERAERLYTAAVEGAGVARAAGDDGWSDEAIDAVALWGDERALAARVRALQEAGADEVVCWPFATGDDAAGSLTATTGALGRLANQTRGAIA